MMERYLVTMQFYVNAENDERAKWFSENVAWHQKNQFDNQAQITELEHAPVGKVGQNRKIKLT